ncbi:sensor histidine kinase [Mycetocola zhujimingii]|uniref:histidine kinase n=1 Tax=Mycetocola zhujimingii TaxID=2079792 RepID=A0A2U1TAG8_9MICO|nr:histidine kinase [Mycetocola zhujimingii]PWC04685.1 hypothetical protein DF223_14700 [Mycetocola zhujimingii]
MTTSPRQSSVRNALWRGTPVVLTALLGIGYVIGVAVIDSESAGQRYPWLPGAIVVAQAVVLLGRYRAPVVVLIATAALDALMLLISSGEASTGTFAVIIAVYSYTRERREASHYLLPAAIAVVSIVLTIITVQSSLEVPGELALPFALLRAALTFGLPVILAEVVDGRARLVEALRERADAAERERERLAQDAVREERALMARELHDIAAHHLTGIIVSAQAADALRATDPDRAGKYIRRVQSDARTTLNNLRQTVGLLRADGEGSLAPVPSIEQLPGLITEASVAGSPVALSESGTPVDIGPLTGITVYRMVQESLANAARHAPGSPRSVELEYGENDLRVTVRNGPVSQAVAPESGSRPRFGLVGMAERADLIGGRLRTGPSTDGGWANILEIPYDGVQS